MAFVRDISRREELERQMLEAVARAETASSAKSDFLACMSHELRTPLNAVLGFAQLLLYASDRPLSPAQKEHIEHILAGGHHLLDLINDILEFSDTAHGGAEIVLGDVCINDVVRDCLETTFRTSQRPDVHMVHMLADAPRIMVRADADGLGKVICGLLHNAKKYNKEFGRVIIDGYLTDEGFFRLTVEDNGVGIPDEGKPSVFLAFSRGGGGGWVARDGLGISLASAKVLLERMSGRIGFESKEGVGSTFWVDLPLAGGNSLAWSDSFLVGVEAIDKDHRHLIATLNRLTERSIANTDIDAAIDELLIYVRDHFRREEAVMKACAFPGYERHKKMHRSFSAWVGDVAERWSAGHNPVLLTALQDFLRNWLVSHIMKSDAEIASAVRGRECDVATALAEIEEGGRALP